MNTTPYANSLFEQPWWLDIVAPGQWSEVLVKGKDDAVIARMPYVMYGNSVITPELTQTLGIWMAPEAQSDYGTQKKIIQEIFEKLDDKHSVVQTLAPCNQYVLPFRWLGYRMEPRFTYRLSDLSDCNALYQNFNKTAKKNIKYAKNKVEVYTETNVETLIMMLDRTFSAQKRKNPMSRDLIQRIVQNCEENHCGKYFEARDPAGNIHSCAYFVFDEKVCYYLLGASDSEFRSSGSQSLLLWEGIQFASTHSEVFDFEGSMVEGIENFFRQFGGICTPYYIVSRRPLIGELIEIIKPRLKRLLGYKI